MKANLIKIIYLTINLLIVSCILQAQNKRCGTVEDEQYILSKNPDLKLIKDGVDMYIRDYLQSPAMQQKTTNNLIIRIPVVVHLIGDYVISSIPDWKVEEQIAILNQDFRKISGTNGYGVGVDTWIEFCLATLDPLDNQTSGIIKISGTYNTWVKDAPDNNSNSDYALKSLSHWNPHQYLNLYVVKEISNSAGTTFAGYAKPSWLLSTYPERDGVVLDYFNFGNNSASPNNGFGRSATHEIGHWLGLKHTWGELPNGADGDCSVDDGFEDTPICDGPYFSDYNNDCPHLHQCTTENNEIESTDLRQIENYMDYSDDLCMNMFTLGQSNYMWATLMTQRYYGNFKSCGSHCGNGIQDSDETGVDCGGNDCAPCTHCNNGVMDGGEYGVDCGGTDCPPCVVTSNCSGDYITASGQCVISGTDYICTNLRWNSWTASSASSGCSVITVASDHPVGRSTCVEINIFPEFEFNAGTYVWQGQTYYNSFQICGGPSFTSRLSNSNSHENKENQILELVENNIDNFNEIEILPNNNSLEYNKNLIQPFNSKSTQDQQNINLLKKTKLEFSIYPNPNTGHFFISSSVSDIMYSFELLNVTNHCVFSKTGLSGNVQVNIAPLSSGVYFIKLLCGEKCEYKKIIKE